ncbi:MAG: hypothetical protein RLZZ540_3538 [Bacteroidota bacterium]|jgi:hypothetical protein
MRKKILIVIAVFIFCNSSLLSAQENLTKIAVNQTDSRIYVELAHTKTAGLGFQWVNVHITNKTSDILRVRLEFTANSTSGVGESMRVGGFGNSDDYLDIKPGQRIGGDQNNCQIQFYGKCKGKEIKVDDGISCIQSVSYKLINIENLSEKERNDAKQKANKEKQQQELAQRNAQAKQDALAKQASIDEQKKIAENEAKMRQEKAKQANEKTESQNNYAQQAANQQRERKEAQDEDYRNRVDAEAKRKRDFEDEQKRSTNNYINQQNAAVNSTLNAMDEAKRKMYAIIDSNTSKSDDDDEAEDREREQRRDNEKRVREEKVEHDELVSNRKSMITNLPEGKMPLSSQTKNAKEVYFFMYSCDIYSLESNPVIYMSNIFTIAKYADDTWPFKDRVMEKIAQTNKDRTYKLSGFYMTKEEAEGQLQQLVNKAYKYGFTIKNVFYMSSKATETANSNIDFWGNPTSKKVEQSKTEIPNTKAKVEYDDWGNPITNKTEQTKKAIPKKAEQPKTTATAKVEYDFWGNPIKK